MNLRILWKNNYKKFPVLKNAMSTTVDNVICERNKNIGVLTLNKPKKLNTLDVDMVLKIKSAILEWKDSCSMVIIKGEGRAFCAGADVVSLTVKGPSSSHIGKRFFKEEYEMNNIIGSYPKPYVALIHGITMGGGVGISVHGSARIATENTLFAMPETAIGLFPDVGLTYLLSRLPGNLGLFLGLTGYRLKGTDVVKAGIATHYVNSTKVGSIFQGLTELKEPKNELKKYLSDNTEDINKIEFSLAPHLKTIEKCFSASTVEGILQNLKNENTEFTKTTIETLQKMSPIALKMSYKIIKDNSKRSLSESLTVEYRLASRISEARASSDFYEGVRALLIDKDQKPQWNPPTLEKATDELVNSAFEELSPEEELKLPTSKL